MSNSETRRKPTLAQLTAAFAKVGNTTFGGGQPSMAALERELSQRKGWLTREEYALAFALARITPGTSIIAFCAATGWQILGLTGAIAGALAETLPSAVLAILMTEGYETWKSNAYILAATSALVAAVVGMMWSTVWGMVRPFFSAATAHGLLRSAWAVVMTGGAFAGLHWFHLGALQIIVLAAVLGMAWIEPSALAKPVARKAEQ
jgi:chromate transporter